MTIGGAISDLNNLLNADDIPFYYKPSIQKVIETIELEQQPCEDCIRIDTVIDWLKSKDIIKMSYQEEAARRELNELFSIQPKPIECEDCISKKAVLNLTKELRFDSVKGMEDYCYRCISPYDVEDLPSVQPKAKVGHWIEYKGRDERDNFYICSECGRAINVICGEILEMYPYCHCGAKMEGATEDV